SGPTGNFSTTGHPDQDGFDYFLWHDPSDFTVYLAIPVLDTAAEYTVTTPSGAPHPSVGVADGVKSLAGDVNGSVSGSGRTFTLNYTINTAALSPGETVSFFEGQSPDVPGANPIVEDATTSGVQTFTPEATGDTTRTIRAVVFDNGVPREQFFIASFVVTDVPP